MLPLLLWSWRDSDRRRGWFVAEQSLMGKLAGLDIRSFAHPGSDEMNLSVVDGADADSIAGIVAQLWQNRHLWLWEGRPFVLDPAGAFHEAHWCLPGSGCFGRTPRKSRHIKPFPIGEFLQWHAGTGQM